MLVKTLLFPYLDYCPGLDLSDELAVKLRRCITPDYERLRILSFDRRRDYFCLLADVLRRDAPSYLRERIQYRACDGLRSRRLPASNLVIPHARTEYYKHAFVVYAARLWNDLPASIRASPSRALFRSRLWNYFLDLRL